MLGSLLEETLKLRSHKAFEADFLTQIVCYRCHFEGPQASCLTARMLTNAGSHEQTVALYGADKRMFTMLAEYIW